MTQKKTSDIEIARFADHIVITQPNRLRRVVRHAPDDAIDDSVARAEAALAGLAGEFKTWMATECERLAATHDVYLRDATSRAAIDDLFRAAHDIKGSAATFGYPIAALTAESLCRIIEHAPDLAEVPAGLIRHHVEAIQAIVREDDAPRKTQTASELCLRLRKLADDYLTVANRDRPEHLEAILAPSIAPD